ncbi:MAG: hypothetical protein K2H09_04145, partial [Treponemataceae bacterium]|nr:hypothetical protein [Treponemataceae bacterium]
MTFFNKSGRKAFFRFLCAGLVLFGAVSAVPADDDAARTTITIENARSTLYEKDKQTGNDCIVLTGDVRISVSKGSTKNVIRADTIRYDRVTEMMYAEGSVELEQTTASSGGQTVTAGSLMFNTSTLEGVFDDGRVVQTKSDALNLPAGSTLIVASDIFGRSESNTIAFKDGVLTFCDDEDPHWRIKASRIWLLPGGEFAFLNALLFVGVVPVAWLPAFYYPKDELIFNPVFGYRPREGYFIQTTAYLYGRKPLESAASSSSADDSDGAEKLKALFNFIKPSSLKQQKLEGIVLHNLDEDYTGDTTNYLKVMGDYYSNLGIMVGLDGVLNPKKVLSSLEVGAQFGFSNTVFRNDGVYVPYDSKGDKIHDTSNLLGFELPFRYSGKFKMSMTKPFSLSLAVPVYSDPYFYDDFSEREESMDWISYVIDSASVDDEDDTVEEISSFTWNLTSSYSVPLPAVIKPYISTASLNVTSSVMFSSLATTDLSTDKTEDALWRSYTPQRKFYYPSQVTPATVNATISGTLFQWSSTKAKSASASGKAVSYVSELVAPEDLRSAKDAAASEPEAGGGGADNADAAPAGDGGTERETPAILSVDALPLLSAASDSVVMIPGIDFSVAYSIRPALSTQLVYSSTNLTKPDDFEWNNLRSSMYTLKIPITLDNSLSYAGDFFSVSNSYTFEPVFQKHPHISTDV